MLRYKGDIPVGKLQPSYTRHKSHTVFAVSIALLAKITPL